MNQYKIYGTRKTAALYLAYEFGIRFAVRRLARLERTRNGGYILAQEKLKRDALKTVAKVQFIVAYQQGRLKQRLGDGHALTVGITR